MHNEDESTGAPQDGRADAAGTGAGAFRTDPAVAVPAAFCCPVPFGASRQPAWWAAWNRTIRCKLTILILGVGLLAVLLELAFLIFYTGHRMRHDMLADAGSVTTALTARAAGPVAAGDAAAAQDLLNSLALEPRAMAATVFDRGGRVLAEYRRGREDAAAPILPGDAERFDRESLTLSRGIMRNGQRVGTVALVYDFNPMKARVTRFFRMGLLVLLLSVVIRVIIVTGVTRELTGPLTALADAARRISERRDYSVRATRATGGEVGRLIDAFNGMVEQIERHDRARAAAEESLRRSEERYALAALGSNDGMRDLDVMRGVTYLSARLNAMQGGEEKETTEAIQEWFARMHPDDQERVQAEVRAFEESGGTTNEIEFRIRHRDGHYVWMLSRGAAVRDPNGRVLRIAGSLSDITQKKTTDAVTGLPNRLFFLDRLQRALEAPGDGGSLVAVLFLELDRFRMLHDSVGHAATDEFLTQVAGRLRSAARGAGREVLVARTGEDEFALLLTELRQASDAVSMAKDTLKKLREPFYLEGKRLPAGAHIGIAIRSQSETPEELLRNAETAMYDASTKGGGEPAIFRTSMRERATARLEIVLGLRQAIEANQLRLHYQPVVSLREHRIIGFESLVRWQHPDRGLLGPGEFISIAEESDLILALGEWVLREACRQMTEWQVRLKPAPPMVVGVNVSVRQLNDPGFADLVGRVLAETGLEPQRLRLEVTESSLASDSGPILETLRTLRAMQVQLVIDDFGTGYSSLSYLQRLPFQVLKIDRSFIRELGAGDGSPEIVRTILRLARALKLKVVAEGVETAEQAMRLTSLGCDLVQGYFFGRPAGAHQAEEMILDRTTIHPAAPWPGPEEFFTESDHPSDDPGESAKEIAWIDSCC